MMAGGHGYYNLEGSFVETASKHEATLAWRTERGYSNVGWGGAAAPSSPSMPVTSTPDVPGPGQQPWEILGQEQPAAGGSTLVGSNIGDRQYSLSQFGTQPSTGLPVLEANTAYKPLELRTGVGDDVSMQSRIEQRGGYTLFDEARARIESRGGYDLDLPRREMTGDPNAFFWERRQQTLDRSLDELNRLLGGGEYHSPWTEAEEVTRQFSQFAGDEFYGRGITSRETGEWFPWGGSEQAELGVYNQQLANLGMLSKEELVYMGLTPTDQMSYVLGPADVRRLTSQDPALSTYADKLREDYGDDWFEELYDVDEATGWAELKTYGQEDPYFGGGWGGYDSGGGGYGSGGYGSTYRAAAQNGLVNWRIGV